MVPQVRFFVQGYVSIEILMDFRPVLVGSVIPELKDVVLQPRKAICFSRAHGSGRAACGRWVAGSV